MYIGTREHPKNVRQRVHLVAAALPHATPSDRHPAVRPDRQGPLVPRKSLTSCTLWDSIVSMEAKGIVFRKMEVIEETLRELRGLDKVTAARLEEDFFLKKGIERALQVCVEAVIDTAHRIVSLADKPPCSTAGKALDAIESLGVIDKASSYTPMVQFRNIVVHRYGSVDNEIIVGILDRHLDDFDRFMNEVRRHAQGRP